MSRKLQKLNMEKLLSNYYRALDPIASYTNKITTPISCYFNKPVIHFDRWHPSLVHRFNLRHNTAFSTGHLRCDEHLKSSLSNSLIFSKGWSDFSYILWNEMGTILLQFPKQSSQFLAADSRILKSDTFCKPSYFRDAKHSAKPTKKSKIPLQTRCKTPNRY